VTAGVTSAPPEAKLDDNVTLQFEFGGERTTLTTADTRYAISSQGNRRSSAGQKHTNSGANPDEHHGDFVQYSTEIVGSVQREAGSERLLVTCSGVVTVARQSEARQSGGRSADAIEMACTIDASAYVTPGEPVLLARSGGESLVLTLVDAVPAGR